LIDARDTACLVRSFIQNLKQIQKCRILGILVQIDQKDTRKEKKGAKIYKSHLIICTNTTERFCRKINFYET